MKRMFYEPPNRKPELMNPLVLAYLGDTLHDLYVRQALIAQPNHRPNYLHHESSRYVSAKAQAEALHFCMPRLSDEEQYVVKRGRNAKSGTIPKHADVMEYRHSTAFECLLGYLYYSDQLERLEELLDEVFAFQTNMKDRPGRKR